MSSSSLRLNAGHGEDQTATLSRAPVQTRPRRGVSTTESFEADYECIVVEHKQHMHLSYMKWLYHDFQKVGVTAEGLNCDSSMSSVWISKDCTAIWMWLQRYFRETANSSAGNHKCLQARSFIFMVAFRTYIKNVVEHLTQRCMNAASQ